MKMIFGGRDCWVIELASCLISPPESEFYKLRAALHVKQVQKGVRMVFDACC